ncbi:MAG: hypothetical protein JSW51_02090 [Gemmatimonadota bacterium]|nr:MAG: hypothetical protein JSW51_02090 [Gemmatimonadota bacterium]
MDWGILIPLAGIAATAVLCFPLVAACVRYVERRGTRESNAQEVDGLREDLRFMRDRLESLEASENRLSDLEERVDFAERLIARDHEAPMVEGKH